MDPGVASLLAGTVTGLFGGGRPSGPNYTKAQYEILNDITRRGMELFDRTDLEASDRKAVDKFRGVTMQDAMRLLGEYDAYAAGAGSPMWKDSTTKSRSRNQIASDAANRTAQMEADLEISRPQRKAALLPNPASAAQAMQGAMAMDQIGLQQAAANQQALFGGVYDLVGMLGKKRSYSGPTTQRQYSQPAGPVDPAALLMGMQGMMR